RVSRLRRSGVPREDKHPPPLFRVPGRGLDGRWGPPIVTEHVRDSELAAPARRLAPEPGRSESLYRRRRPSPPAATPARQSNPTRRTGSWARTLAQDQPLSIAAHEDPRSAL